MLVDLVSVASSDLVPSTNGSGDDDLLKDNTSVFSDSYENFLLSATDSMQATMTSLY